MDKSTRAARGRANLLRVTDQKDEKHLLLVTSESTLHDQTISGSTPERRHAWINAKIEVRMQYLDGPLLRENGGMWPATEFKGEITTRPVPETDGWHQNVRLSSGFVIIEIPALRGLGVGTHLFVQLVRWAQLVAPQGDVEPIKLSRHQADGSNRDLRNAFYEKFGFVFDYRAAEGVERAEGSSRPIKVSELKVPDNFHRIEELPLADTLRTHYKNLQFEREKSARETERLRGIEADYRALCRDTSWAMRFGLWRHRARKRRDG